MKNQDVKMHLDFSVEGIRAAVKNAVDVQKVVLDVPCVDPRKLHIDDKIYGLKVVPVKDSEKSKTPSVRCTVGVVEINIDNLSGVVKQGYVTVNTGIDIPKELGRTNAVTDVYFESKEAARQVAMIFLEEEMVRAEEAVTEAKEIREFLAEQLENERV